MVDVVVMMVLLHLESILYAPEGESAWGLEYRHYPSGLPCGGKLCFQRFHFSEPAHVAFLVGEFCSEKGFHEVFGQFHADHTRAQHQHVDVVVLYSLMR